MAFLLRFGQINLERTLTMKKLVISILAAVTLIFSGNQIFAEDTAPTGSFTYPIKRGTNLTRIAKDFGVSNKALIEANRGNPSFKSPNKILAGGKLNIPNVYTKADVSNIRSADAKKSVEAIQAVQKTRRAESSNSSIKVFLLIIGGFVLFVFWTKGLADYWDEKTRLEETKKILAQTNKDFHAVCLSNGEKDQIIKSLKTNLQVSQEQVSALEQAKNEAEKLRNQLNEAFDNIATLEKALKDKVSANDMVIVQSKDHGAISLLVNRVRLDPITKELEVFVECPAENCIVNTAQSLKLRNALSHMAGHSNLLP
ncbi:hypothetical protein A2924_02365 [Candidatus Giovannonibacteria bacterium RIFCSPLOWO2_01_FULL_44_16]|uniref:LysM domain-containing protein n=2 Tax=Candidatus Giovannoniibacteriota TaxID=1752738 RepID=A0A1F5X0Z0_9BACT|nr:MAG: hypothetical protein A2924_02365 [Candidatus Giovannonibacteria bacterium RIFCSPLOWO2_01_FULL_44_16]